MSNRDAFTSAWDGWLDQWTIPVRAVRKNDTVDTVIKLVLEQEIGTLPVIDDKGLFCGIIRASDVMRWSIVPVYSFITHPSNVPDLSGAVDHFFRYTNDVSATEIMVQDESLIVHPEMSTSQIFYIFAKNDHDILFVVDSKQNIKGLVSKIDFLKIYRQFSDARKYQENRTEQQPA